MSCRPQRRSIMFGVVLAGMLLLSQSHASLVKRGRVIFPDELEGRHQSAISYLAGTTYQDDNTYESISQSPTTSNLPKNDDSKNSYQDIYYKDFDIIYRENVGNGFSYNRRDRIHPGLEPAGVYAVSPELLAFLRYRINPPSTPIRKREEKHAI